MKKLIVISFLTLITTGSFAQSYIPFPTNYSQWNQVEIWFDGVAENSFNYQYVLNGDTVIDNINYHKVFQIRFETTEFVGGMREDSIKNIFFYPANESFYLVNFPSDTTEYLLYSFNNLNIGSFVSINNQNFYVHGIDSVLLGSTYHKRYLLNNSHYWIEGIGSNVELFSNYVRSLSSTFYTLCFKPDSLNTFYINSPDENDWCYFNVSTNDIDIEELTVYPNPASDNIYLKSEMYQYADFIISDISGKVLLNGKIGTNKPISIANLKTGLYFITLLSNNAATATRFIKLDKM